MKEPLVIFLKDYWIASIIVAFGAGIFGTLSVINLCHRPNLFMTIFSIILLIWVILAGLVIRVSIKRAMNRVQTEAR